jgi:hypothetical protein
VRLPSAEEVDGLAPRTGLKTPVVAGTAAADAVVLVALFDATLTCECVFLAARL